MEFFSKIFDTSDFPARWHCGDWTPGHGWLHILSDLGVWSAYVAIPLVLGYFLLKRRDLPFRKIFVLFGAFILACGTTHLMEAIIFWWPAYRLAGLIKLFTAVVSWSTVVALVPIIPRVLAMRSPEELEREIAARKLAEAALQDANERLEHRIDDRTAELVAANAALRLERERFRTTLASIGDAVIATDATGSVTFVNPVASDLTGWGEEALGAPVQEVFNIVNEQTGQVVESPVDKVLREGAIVGLANHTVLIDKSGGRRPIDDSGAPIRDDQGQIVGVVMVFRDVAERRRADEDLRRAHEELEIRVGERTAELSHANQFLSALLDSLQEGIVACNAEGVLTLFNRATREFHGLPQEPIPAENWAEHYDLFRGDGLTRMSKDEVPLFRALRGESVIDAEMVIAPKNGPTIGCKRALLANGRPFRDAQGALLGAVVSMHDITLQKEAEAALQKSHEELEARVAARTAELAAANAALEAEVAERRRAEEQVQRVADAVPSLISYIDNQGRYRLNNRAYETWFGRSRDEITGRHMREVLGDEAWSVIRPQFEQAREGAAVRYETKAPYRDGGHRWISADYVPDIDATGAVRGIVAHVNDITAYKEAQEALREADRRKDDFLAILAHELRNPLAPLRNGLQVLRLAGEDPPKAQQARAMMERQLEHLVHLVDDLLDVSRITRGKVVLRKEPIEAAAIVASAVETCEPLIRERKHELVVDLPHERFYVEGDPVRLTQSLCNLLSNAAKYTDPGGKIVLAVERRTTPDGLPGVAMKVTDNGIGIPKAMLPKVFEMFVQVDRSLEKAQGGLGIGLTIVRRLIEMHGGAVSATSAGAGLGSEFSIVLPEIPAPESAVDSTSRDAASPRSSARKVLVVDDNRDSAQSLAMLLGLLGNEVFTAHDGLQAVRIAEERRPDLVLMDVGMPKLNGFDATRRIRQQPWGKTMTIVALTGWGQEEDRRQSQAAGCDAHLVKPVELAALEKILASVAPAG